jgi:hypothetical protein
MRIPAMGAFVILLAALCVSSGAQEPPPDSFEAKLEAIDIEVRKQETSAEKLEDQYLALLEGDLTPEQRGLVYVHITNIGRYCHVPGDVREAYALEALSYPLATTDALAMHVARARILRKRYADWRGRRFALGRRRIVDAALAALKFALDNGAPRKRVPLPGIGRMSAVEPSEEDRRRHEAQVAARGAAQQMERLWGARLTMTHTCAELYSRQPVDPEELRARASEALKDYPEAVQDVMDKLEEMLAYRRGERPRPPAPTLGGEE